MIELKKSIFRYIQQLQKSIRIRQGKYFNDLKNDLTETSKAWHGVEVSRQSASKGSVLIISFSNLPFLLKAHGLLGYLFQRMGYRPVLITNSGNNWASKYCSIFGVKDIINWNRELENIVLPQETHRVIDQFLSTLTNAQQIKTFAYKGANIGKHSFSTLIRKELKGTMDLTNPDFRLKFKTYLLDACKTVDLTRLVIEKYRVTKVIVRDAGYLPNGAIYETALQHNIEALRFESAQMLSEWQVKKYNAATKGQALFSLSPDKWEHVRHTPLTPQQASALQQDFVERYDPKSDRDMYKYQQGKVNFSKDQVIRDLVLDRSKKTAVVFSHITWDANFFDGEDLYDNFEHWLVETVRIAIKNPNLNWVIKLHPANVYKLARENDGKGVEVETELEALAQLGPLPEHVKIMRAANPINTWSLISVTDYGLTVRGTIGMELPCLGIPVVTAGTGRYSRYGFTIDPDTREEYERTLLNLHLQPKLDDNTIELARRHAYWVFLNRTVNFNSISVMTSTVLNDPNHPLHHNFTFKPGLKSKLEGQELQDFSAWLDAGKHSDYLKN
jgi:hypothetical protein